VGLLIVRSSGGGVDDPFTDTFSSTNNPIASPWQSPNGTGFTPMRTANGTAYGTNGVTDTYDDSYAYLTGYTDDHEVSAVIHRGTTTNFNHEVELHLRLSEPGGASTYEILFNREGGFQVVRWNNWTGGTQDASGATDITGLGSSGPGSYTTPSNGDTIRARIVGQTITVWYNETQIWTYTDNSASKLTTGNPGIGTFYRPGASPPDFGFQSVTVSSV
jgi:hypothetical protein